MNVKQDRQGVRTAQDLERKYNLGYAIAEAKQIAEAARRAAANAVTKDYVDTGLAGKADKQYVDTELAGKAPAGYGLGSEYCPTVADLDDFTLVNGVYNVNETTANKPSGITYAFLHVFSRYGSKAYVLYEQVARGCILVRHIVNNAAVTDWEWENPPMVLGTEYRTTKRHQGKTVFTKAVSLGALPNAGSMQKTGLASGKKMVSYQLTIENSTTGGGFINDQAISCSVGQSGDGWIWCSVKTTNDQSAWTGVLTMEYTKE